MPKKIDPEEEYEEEEEEEEEDEEDEEEDEEVAPKRTAKRKPAPKPVQKRYVAFKQEAAEGMMDNETKEVIASDIWSALADIKSQLDRIENAIGVL